MPKTDINKLKKKKVLLPKLTIHNYLMYIKSTYRHFKDKLQTTI